MSTIQVGDRVAYTHAWLRNTSTFSGPFPRARGTVAKLIQLGSITLAEIDWNDSDIPDRVNTANLCKVTEFGVMDPTT